MVFRHLCKSEISLGSDDIFRCYVADIYFKVGPFKLYLLQAEVTVLCIGCGYFPWYVVSH